MKKITNILVVDDEKDIRDSLGDILSDEGFNVFLANNAANAINIKKKQKIDLILLDIWMPDTDGISLLKSWAKNKEIDCPVLMMSGHGTIDTAIEATKIGATDCSSSGWAKIASIFFEGDCAPIKEEIKRKTKRDLNFCMMFY